MEEEQSTFTRTALLVLEKLEELNQKLEAIEAKIGQQTGQEVESNPQPMPEVLTQEELQAFLRVGSKKAYAIGEKIPHFKNGRNRLYYKEDVLNWIQAEASGKSNLVKLQDRLKDMGGGVNATKKSKRTKAGTG